MEEDQDPFASLNKLKKLGLEINPHVLYEDSNHIFFKWLSENITEDNILIEYELREHDELQKNNSILSTEELKKHLIEIDKKYPNILNYTERDLSKYEAELEELVLIEESYEILISDMKKNNQNLSKELCKIENEKIELDFLCTKLSQNCIEKSKEFYEFQYNNQQKLNDLQQSFLKPHMPPLFIHQLSLEQYTGKCEQLHKYIDVYMHKHFKIKNTEDDELLDDECCNIDSYVEDIQEIKERLFAAGFLLDENVSDSEGQKYLISKMEPGQMWQPMTYDNMRIQTREFTTKANELLVYLEALNQDSKSLLNQLTEQKIDFILYDYNKKKLERAKKRYESIQSLSKIVLQSSLNDEFLWILMQLDLERINSVVNFIQSEQLNKETYACMKRIDSLKLFLKDSSIDVCKKFTDEFGSIMATQLDEPKYQMLNYKDCAFEYNGIKKGIKKRIENLIEKKFYQNSNQLLKEINEKNQILFKYIDDGPLVKPQLIDPIFSKKLYVATQKSYSVEKLLKQCKIDYQKNISEPMNSDKFWRFYQLLWVWFLTEPIKVINAIKEVSTAAANLQSSAFKSISGIMCKKNEKKI